MRVGRRTPVAARSWTIVGTPPIPPVPSSWLERDRPRHSTHIARGHGQPEGYLRRRLTRASYLPRAHIESAFSPDVGAPCRWPRSSTLADHGKATASRLAAAVLRSAIPGPLPQSTPDRIGTPASFSTVLGNECGNPICDRVAELRSTLVVSRAAEIVAASERRRPVPQSLAASYARRASVVATQRRAHEPVWLG